MSALDQRDGLRRRNDDVGDQRDRRREGLRTLVEGHGGVLDGSTRSCFAARCSSTCSGSGSERLDAGFVGENA